MNMAKRGRPAKAEVVVNFKQINANVLVQLIKTKAENKTKIGELNGEFGSQIKHHAEMSGLNKDAFGFVAKLNKMNEQNREACRASLSLYCDMMIEKGVWSKHFGDLAAQAEAASREPVPVDDEQEEAEEDPRPQFTKDNEAAKLAEEAAAQAQVQNNVTNIQRGIKPLAAAG